MAEPAGFQRPNPTARDEILGHLDRATTQRFHRRTIVIAGMGFFSDAYDLFVISLVLPLLTFLYPAETSLLNLEIGLLAAAALFGAVIGQVLFGYLGDRMGRKKVYAITLSVMAVGSVGSGLAVPMVGVGTIVVVALWRFLMGIGVGGDYPLSATIMSEFSNVRSRGRFVASVFAMQGFGLLAGAVVMVGALLAFPASPDVVWRVVLGLGAFPALATIYFRTRMPETPRFTLAVKGDTNVAAKDVGSLTGKSVAANGSAAHVERASFGAFLQQYGAVLFGTAASWFLLDMAFYSSNIFNPTILKIIGLVAAKTLTAANWYGSLLTLAEGQTLIALVALIPGYWAAVLLIDRWGRRRLQLIGFLVAAVAFLIVGAFYEQLLAYGLFLILPIYASTFFFMNFGPNTTTFVLPSEVYPTQFRGTGHGISAASGKMGAAIATFLFPAMLVAFGLPTMLALLGGFCLLGLLVTVAFTPETAGKTLEAASREDDFLGAIARFSFHLDALTDSIERGATELQDLLDHPADRQAERVARIRSIEHESDEIVHGIFVDLNNRRMDPAVRADVASLASKLDDIMDGIEAVSARMQTYHLNATDEAIRKFAAIVVASVRGIREGLAALDELPAGRTEKLQGIIVEVNRLENEADDLLRQELSRLFDGTIKDPITVLKLKDFSERLEIITDRCEDVADVFKDLSVRYGPAPAGLIGGLTTRVT